MREILKNQDIGLTPAQIAKIKDYMRSGRMEQVSLKIDQSNNARFSAVRSGHVGYQRMSFEVREDGYTKRIVQTAFDDTNTLVRQRPGQSKNNLYDVKK